MNDNHLNLDMSKLYTYFTNCLAHKVGYKLGGKCSERSLGQLPIPYSHIDCSGFVRSALIAAGLPSFPDGSWVQEDWVKTQGFKRDDGQGDNKLRIAFYQGSKIDSTRHVWLEHQGITLESCTERKGVGSFLIAERRASLSSGNGINYYILGEF
jgi:cell wall-associated NlpC family hydrolase